MLKHIILVVTLLGTLATFATSSDTAKQVSFHVNSYVEMEEGVELDPVEALGLFTFTRESIDFQGMKADVNATILKSHIDDLDESFPYVFVYKVLNQAGEKHYIIVRRGSKKYRDEVIIWYDSHNNITCFGKFNDQ